MATLSDQAFLIRFHDTAGEDRLLVINLVATCRRGYFRSLFSPLLKAEPGDWYGAAKIRRTAATAFGRRKA